MREYHYGIYGLHERFKEVELSECELGTLISDDEDGSDYHYSYFIKDEEDKYGDKLSKSNLQ